MREVVLSVMAETILLRFVVFFFFLKSKSLMLGDMTGKYTPYKYFIILSICIDVDFYLVNKDLEKNVEFRSFYFKILIRGQRNYEKVK